MKQSTIKLISLYILLLLIIFSFYRLELLEKYSIYLVLGFVLIMIKDILGLFFEQKGIKKTVYSLDQISTDISSGKIKKIYLYLFINRHYFFPIMLVGYLIYLLISQTHLFGLNTTSLFLLINSNLLLGLTIISGILTIFKEEQDNNYKQTIETTQGISTNIILTVVLSLIGTYIILIQTGKLGFLSYPISIISGLLILLVGISILEDNDMQEIKDNIALDNKK